MSELTDHRSYDNFDLGAIYTNDDKPSSKGWQDDNTGKTPINASNLNAMLSMLIAIRDFIGKKADFNVTDNKTIADIIEDLNTSISTYVKTLKLEVGDGVSIMISEDKIFRDATFDIEATGDITINASEYYPIKLYGKELLFNNQSIALRKDIPTDYLDESDLSGYSKFSGSYNDLTDKPIIPSTQGLASEEWVNNKNYLTQETYNTEKTEFALKSDLFSKSYNDLTDKPDIPSVEGLASTGYVDARISDIVIPENVSDFNNDVSYVTETELEQKGYLTEHQSLAGYATQQWVEDKGYLTEHQSLEDYAKKSDIPTIPTKISAFENDKGYLTQHQDLSNYALKSEIPTIPTNVSVFTNDANYVDKDYVDDAIASINIPEAPETDLSNYYTKSEVNDLISDFISEIPSEYITETELAAEGFVKEQSLEDYVKKNEITASFQVDGTKLIIGGIS